MWDGVGSEVGLVRFSREGHPPGPGQFVDAELAHEQQELLDLAFIASDLDSQIVVLHVDDFRAKNVADLHDFRPAVGVHLYAHQDEFALDDFFVPIILNGNYVHQLVQLLGDLLQDRVVATDGDRHTGGGGIHCRSHVEGVDIEPTTAEHSGNARQHAEFVFNEDGDGVAHKEKVRRLMVDAPRVNRNFRNILFFCLLIKSRCRVLATALVRRSLSIKSIRAISPATLQDSSILSVLLLRIFRLWVNIRNQFFPGFLSHMSGTHLPYTAFLNHLASILNALPDAAFVSGDSKVVFANSHASKCLNLDGYVPPSMAGHTWVRLRGIGGEELPPLPLQTQSIQGIGEWDSLLLHTIRLEDLPRQASSHKESAPTTAPEPQGHLLGLITSGASLEEILDYTVKAAEREDPTCLCSILVLDHLGKRLLVGAAPSLAPEFNAAIDGILIGDGVGCCGTAAFKGERVIAENIYESPLWAPYRAIADLGGVRSCWSQPIFSSEKRVLGTFAIYHRKPCVPTDADIARIEAAARYISLAIERKRATDALRASESRIHAIVHNTPNVAIQIYDMVGRIQFWNEASVRMFGWSAEEAIGKTLEDLIYEPHQQQEFLQLLQRLVGTGNSYGPAELPFCNRDGVTCWGLSTIFEIPGFASEPLFVCMDVNITERKEAEIALRQSEERFREVVENIQEVFWVTDAGRTEMLYISPGFTRIWGFRSEECKSPERWQQAIHPDDRNRPSMMGATKFDEEYRIIRPDGAVRWIHDRAFPITDADGRVVRVAGVAEDITERRQIEERFRQAQKMEAVGQLAGGVAHDFNNILAAILMEVDLAKGASRAHPDLVIAFENIRSAAERAATLTERLLLFSRRQMMQPRRVDLNELVANLAIMLDRLLGERVRLRLYLAPEQLVVEADPGMIDQVVMNLAVNARDAMPDGGQLSIKTAILEVNEVETPHLGHLPPGQYVCLMVSDTGTGMTEEVKQHLFEPFFTTKEVGKGTGLGLATVFGIVQQHRGWVKVESVLQTGTIFHVYLPALPSQAPAKEGEKTHSTIGRPGAETILLVEDEAPVRAVTRRLLERHGYRVLDASCGRDALRVWDCFAGNIDLLLTDLVMPEGMDGIELARELRLKRPSLKIIYTSGYTPETDSPHGVDASIPFLQKPTSMHILLETVRRCLDAQDIT